MRRDPGEHDAATSLGQHLQRPLQVTEDAEQLPWRSTVQKGPNGLAVIGPTHGDVLERGALQGQHKLTSSFELGREGAEVFAEHRASGGGIVRPARHPPRDGPCCCDSLGPSISANVALSMPSFLHLNHNGTEGGSELQIGPWSMMRAVTTKHRPCKATHQAKANCQLPTSRSKTKASIVVESISKTRQPAISESN